MIGLKDYTNQRKETWRGWQWNRVLNAIASVRSNHRVSRKNPTNKRHRARLVNDATILYLAGPEAIDALCGESKGVDNLGLIGVDENLSNVKRIRKSGHLAIHARLEDVLLAWPNDWPIDAVIADTCSCVSRRTLGLLAAFSFCGGFDRLDTVVSLNLQRGRESRDFWPGIKLDAIETEKELGIKLLRGPSEKHRGLMLLLGWFQYLAGPQGELLQDLESCWMEERIGDLPEAFPSFLFTTAGVEFASYRSNKVVMDSVVCSWYPFIMLSVAASAMDDRVGGERYTDRIRRLLIGGGRVHVSDFVAKRSITALRATITRLRRSR